MHIRKVNLIRDIEPLVKMIYQEVPRPQKMKHYLEETVKWGGTILIAEENGERIGFIVLKIVDQPFREKLYGMVDFYYILPHRDRKIVLEALITAIETWCEARRLSGVEIKVENEDVHLKEVLDGRMYRSTSKEYHKPIKEI